MNQSTVAERFNTTSESLELKGHRVIVRRARLLLEGGQADQAVAFLEDAGKRMRGLGVDGLAAALREWHDAGGDPGALVTDPAWVKGAATDHMRARIINQLTHGADLSTLAGALADQEKALAAGEPLSGPPDVNVAPDKLPPLPRMGEGKKSLGDVFSRPAVEAPSQLEARDLELDEPAAVEAEEEAVVVNVERTPPPAASTDDVLKLVSQPPEDFPVVPPPSRAGSGQSELPPASVEMADSVELSPAPTDTTPPPAEPGTSSSVMLLMLAALVGIAAAIYWFASRS